MAVKHLRKSSSLETLHALLCLQIADTYYNNNKPVNILVGFDYFYNFITRKTLKMVPNTLVALESNLGFLICRQSQINPKKQGASNMTNSTT